MEKHESNVVGYGITNRGKYYLLVGIREVPAKEKPGCLVSFTSTVLLLLALVLLVGCISTDGGTPAPTPTPTPVPKVKIVADDVEYRCQSCTAAKHGDTYQLGLVRCSGYLGKNAIVIVRNVKEYTVTTLVGGE